MTMEIQLNQKIARLHQKLANAEVALREVHRLIDELRAWLRELADEERATYEIEQNPELLASLDRAREDIRKGRLLSHQDIFGEQIRREGTS